MDLVQATNATEPVRFGGREFPVRQLRLHEWAALQSWLKQALPDPVARALKTLQALKDQGVAIDPDLRDATIARASAEARAWPPRVGSQAWLQAIDQAEGGEARFIRAALAAGGTELADDQVEDLAKAATDEEFAELVRVAYLGDPPRPKAPAPSTPSASSPGAGPRPASRTRSTSGGRRSRPSHSPAAGPTSRSGS